VWLAAQCFEKKIDLSRESHRLVPSTIFFPALFYVLVLMLIPLPDG
jgi:hypothetical protein